MYIVIMAGGQGTRLWPMSRQDRPKQLFELVSHQTLLQDTIERLLPTFSLDQIYIATNQKYIKEISKQVPKLPISNIISEPELRDTAACIGLATSIIHKKDPKAIIGVLPSDHYIEKKQKFIDILLAAEKLAIRENTITILGIKPTFPATELGYINSSRSAKSITGHKVYHVRKFIEKPDLITAKKYFKSWKYFWNAGMFIYPAQKMLNSFKEFLPNSYTILQKIQLSLGTKKEKTVIQELYPSMDKISVDYGIMEKSNDLLVIPADIGWSDIGNWGSLKDVLSPEEDANVTKGNLITIDTKGSLIYAGKKPIATIGVDNLIIVDTEDILMVCPKNKATEMKKLIEHLKQNGQDQYL